MFDQGYHLGAFATLRSAIERRLRLIVSRQLNASRMPTMYNLLDLAVRKEVIDWKLADAIKLVTKTANQIIHSEGKASLSAMREMIDLGINVLTRLDEVIPDERRLEPETQKEDVKGLEPEPPKGEQKRLDSEKKES